MVRVLTEASSWQNDEYCGKEQGRNEIVGYGAWSSHTREALQQLSFGNSVSPDDVNYFYAELVVVIVLLSLGP
ncbi:hypothetical protein TIFTF001_009776 [Ficus carica]|uniref:Uncharacterized protein n=1 Tax=Ficus carica TaxID=3494 RepID=A0AA87ZUB1_FICCA|nr:hypothetical protein TIFTF001_009776 [Ficus carica]